jgi:nitrogen fixation protein FixH
MRFRISPNVTWPLFIVFLLSISITAAVYTYFAANSGAGAQIVEDYYNRALQWEDEFERRTNADRLGWNVRVSVSDSVVNGLRPVYLDITNGDGSGIGGVRGTVRAYRPHLAGALAEVPLVAVSESPGRYRQLLPAAETGLWDFELRARSDGDPVFVRQRVDILH